MLQLKIVIIGAGNVAWHLGKGLQDKGQIIHQVYNRSIDPAISLSKRLQCDYTNKIKDISTKADLYIIATKDSAIKKISESLNINNQLVVHTSGIEDINTIKHNRNGVFYPLQTISKKRKLDFKNTPFCIETSRSKDLSLLSSLAKLLGSKVYNINTHQRKVIHVAAVFACNFSNYMYMISEEILSKEKIPLEILNPLIQETANKINNHKPKDVQTGPAMRKDIYSIKKHLEYLKEGNKHDIYKLITENIIAINKHEL